VAIRVASGQFVGHQRPVERLGLLVTPIKLLVPERLIRTLLGLGENAGAHCDALDCMGMRIVM
jgi:hypothetical protein